jgi:hypothetical protein
MAAFCIPVRFANRITSLELPPVRHPRVPKNINHFGLFLGCQVDLTDTIVARIGDQQDL